jgi:hypothetical protein
LQLSCFSAKRIGLNNHQLNRSSGFLMVAEGKWENEMAS